MPSPLAVTLLVGAFALALAGWPVGVAACVILAFLWEVFLALLVASSGDVPVAPPDDPMA